MYKGFERAYNKVQIEAKGMLIEERTLVKEIKSHKGEKDYEFPFEELREIRNRIISALHDLNLLNPMCCVFNYYFFAKQWCFDKKRGLVCYADKSVFDEDDWSL